MAEHNRKNPDAPMTQDEGIACKPEGYEKYGRNKEGKPKDSYEAGYSNVSILERMNLKRRATDKAVSVYVEGIGTQDNLGDDKPGNMFGILKTGIKNKVQIGVGRLAEGIVKVLEKQEDTQVEQLTIDVFGFSRGAAAARHFVSLMSDKTPLATRVGAPKAEVKIRFVGVFDTVSSYGTGLSFGSSVTELGLALGGVPQKVVHLAAGDERRANFSLTDITSSLGNGYQLTLPGVHSDVGGGYAEREHETRQVAPNERTRLLAQGWYLPDQLQERVRYIQAPNAMVPPMAIPYLEGTRRLRWDYQFIPLRLMATYAKQNGLELAGTSGKFAKYALLPGHPLLPVQAAIEAAAAQHGAAGQHALTLEKLGLSPALIRRVRNRYLHLSVSDSTGMGARYVNGQPGKRQVFPG